MSKAIVGVVFLVGVSIGVAVDRYVIGAPASEKSEASTPKKGEHAQLTPPKEKENRDEKKLLTPTYPEPPAIVSKPMPEEDGEEEQRWAKIVSTYADEVDKNRKMLVSINERLDKSVDLNRDLSQSLKDVLDKLQKTSKELLQTKQQHEFTRSILNSVQADNTKYANMKFVARLWWLSDYRGHVITVEMYPRLDKGSYVIHECRNLDNADGYIGWANNIESFKFEQIQR